MEPHPIPQNVASFQFRLIGDMTLKQFVYLATGSIVAYLIFIFFAAKYPVSAWPLILISAGLGVAFAFLGVGSRPLDYWLAAFLKAIYSPTKRVWKKSSKTYSEDPLFKSRYITYISGLNPQTTPRMVQPTALPAQPAPRVAPAPSTPLASPASGVASRSEPTDLPTSEELQKTVALAKQAQNLQMKIIQSERELNQVRTEGQVNEILNNLQNLVSQATSIKAQLEGVTKGGEAKAESAPPPKVIKVAIPVKPKLQQIALTTFPNVISGIVKSGTGNSLEGVIAVIHDKDGLPVRALKTNKLGQFSGSTPLSNGVYTLELEKENYDFDVLQIELTGGILPPLMIVGKEGQ